MDYQQIIEVTSKADNELPRYVGKRWVKIHPQENSIGSGAVNYNCQNVADKWVSYSDGYLLLTAELGRTELPSKTVAPKASFSFLDQVNVLLNNQEVDQSRFCFISNAILNALEYSPDYAKVAERYCYAWDTSKDDTNNSGHTTRKLMIPSPTSNKLTFNLKIPLSYVSTFFRRLDFPIINQRVELQVRYRTTNAVLREEGGEVTVDIKSAVLHLPIVEFPHKYESQIMQKLSRKSFTRELVWDKFVYPEASPRSAGALDISVATSAVAAKKLLCLAVPNARWDSQQHIETTSDSHFTNLNIVIDSEEFYPQDIAGSPEAYELLVENFNMGGKDPNTGSQLSYSDWLTNHRYYVFDLSRQKVFERDPRKAQTIRFRGTLSADSRVLFFLTQEKVTTFDFADPHNTKTI